MIMKARKTLLATFGLLLLTLGHVLAQPVITTQPQDQAVRAGGIAFFTVTATGTPPVTYQWRKDGADILDATGSTCSLGFARADQAGIFAVVVRDPGGSVTSAAATLTVLPAAFGSVVAWGDYGYHQTEVPPEAQSGVTAVAAGWYHTVALKNDGSVLAWGRNDTGQTTVPLAAQSGVMAIAGGGSHTVALKNNGMVMAWGNNVLGQTIVPADLSGVAAVAAGYLHTVALKTNGSVVAWGDNRSGQTTVPITASSGVMAIAAGSAHTVALKSDGSVLAWGDNGQGQTTVPVAAQSGVVAITAGGGHTAALKTNGSVVVWGSNIAGQTNVPFAAQSGVAAIVAGAGHTVALKKDGSVVAWGLNSIGQTTVPLAAQSGVVAIAAGGEDTVAVFIPTLPAVTVQPLSQAVDAGQSARLTVAAAGLYFSYQWRKDGVDIAGATNATYSLSFAQPGDTGNYTVVVSNVAGSVTSEVATLTVHSIVQFSATRYTVWETGGVASITVVRVGAGPDVVTVNYATSDGTATAGQDYTATSGTLTFGPGEVERNVTIPILDNSLAEGAKYLYLTLGGLTGCPIFGANTNAELTIMDDEQSSAPVPRARPVIAAGVWQTVALKADGTLWAWGEIDPGSNVPARVGADHDWATVAVGRNHTVAVKADGSLWAWGANWNGQLGVGVAYINVPVRVGSDQDWEMVAAGWYHTVALKSDGSLWTWGDNSSGQLGTGTDLSPTNGVPVRVGLDSDWLWVGAAGFQTLGVKKDGSLWAWGDNSFGQLGLGDGSPTLTNAPGRAGLEGDWEMVVTAGGKEGWSSSTGDSLALQSDGTLWSWGKNKFGQLGNGTTAGQNVPTRLGAEEDWAVVAAGIHHTLGIKIEGSLWAWGENASGRLGIGTDVGPPSLEPNRVGTDSDWVAVAAGDQHSIGLKSDGSLWAWGANGNGQLGLGGLDSTNLPTRIGSDNDWALPVAPAVAGDFRITAQSTNPDHSRTIFFTQTNSQAYYILYRGDSMTNISQPVDVALASHFPRLTDHTRLASKATMFYRIRAVPRTQPLDLDGDGIDDYYELRHAAFLNPLNPADAAQDYDGDGYSNLSEYRAGTDPTRPTVRHIIASGLGHTVVLKQDGSLWAWGDNTYGQLGDGTYDSHDQPVRIGTDNDWVSVSTGRDFWNGDHSVGLKRDGRLWAWGANAYGQLGDGTTVGRNVPARVGNENNWVDVSAGGGYTAALKSDGSLWAWGNSSYVIRLSDNSLLPARIGTDTNWLTIAAGGLHILALKTDHSLWAWGDNESGQCGLGVDVVGTVDQPTRVGNDNDWTAIAASGAPDIFEGASSLALKAGGLLWAWGDNTRGQLGLGIADSLVYVPTRVGTDTDWVSIAAGCVDSLARKRDGSLWAWGSEEANTPSLVSNSRDWGEIAVEGNDFFSVSFASAIKTDGSLWSWRFESPRSPIPLMVGTNADWSAIAAGGFHSLALKTNGSLWAWGDGGNGQLGDGTFSINYIPQPIQTDMAWKAVAAGGGHSLALNDTGTLWTWGDNYRGQLGDGTFNNANTPQPILTNMTWNAIAAGGAHTVALRDDSTLWVWGENIFGQLGIGSFATNFPYGFSTAQAIQTNMTWKTVSAGYAHTLAIRDDGTLWTWGHNDFGELGNGAFNNANTPQPIQSDMAWKAVAAGGSHTVALRVDGTLWAWGYNGQGQLGIGTFSTTNTPQLIQSDMAWKAVAAGNTHTVALREDGTLWTWGQNYYGQLGNGTFNNANTPQLIQTNMTWKAVAGGGSHTLAIREDGTLWSWGANASGQLGMPPEITPLRVGTANDWGVAP